MLNCVPSDYLVKKDAENLEATNEITESSKRLKAAKGYLRAKREKMSKDDARKLRKLDLCIAWLGTLDPPIT